MSEPATTTSPIAPPVTPTPAASPAPPSTRNLWLVRGVTVLAVVGSIALTYLLRDHIGELRAYMDSPLGLLLVFVVSIVSSANLFLPLPGLGLTALFGAAGPPLLVGIVAGIGQTIGELTGYMAGYSGQTLVLGNPRYARMWAWMRRYGVVTLFVLGAVPNMLFDVAGIVAGALRMPVWQFLVGTGLGKILKNVAFAYLGYYSLDAFLHWIGR